MIPQIKNGNKNPLTINSAYRLGWLRARVIIKCLCRLLMVVATTLLRLVWQITLFALRTSFTLVLGAVINLALKIAIAGGIFWLLISY